MTKKKKKAPAEIIPESVIPKEQDKRSIEVSKIVPGINPRGTIQDEGISELTENIKTHGLINALLVRPVKKGYEIVAGNRRLKAVKSLKWEKVDCVIMDLTDEEAFEYAVIENLQREDVHPLDEAKAFETILKRSSIEDLAARVNKTESYIIRRTKLSDLIEPLKQAYYAGDITLSHCEEICRLSKDLQIQCLDWLKEDVWNDVTESVTIFKPVKLLKLFINTNLLTLLSSAPFSLEATNLHPKAGSCLECPKRTGANENLFNDYQKNDSCLDKDCYQIKVNTLIKIKAAELTEEGYKPILLTDGYCDDLMDKQFKGKTKPDYQARILKKETKNSQKAIYVNGPLAGHVVHIADNTAIENISTRGDNSDKTEMSPEEQIAKIKERLSRAKEKDRGRQYAEMKNEILDKISLYDEEKECKDIAPLSDLEEELFIYSLYVSGNIFLRDLMNKMFFGMKKGTSFPIDGLDEKEKADNQISQKLSDIAPKQKSQIMRVFLKRTLFINNASAMERNIYLSESLRNLASIYNYEKTEEILEKYLAIRMKREKNANAKIEALEKEISEQPEKKSKKK